MALLEKMIHVDSFLIMGKIFLKRSASFTVPILISFFYFI